MKYEIDKNNLSSVNRNRYSQDIDELDLEYKDESDMEEILKSGRGFINTVSTVFSVFMGIANWIMNKAYLIAVIIVFVLFVIKLKG